ncbi:hypothetical protein Taro_012579, partial [Colocasia esculenta]|nr:hypothetical protein [Colocasia esculenta]
MKSIVPGVHRGEDGSDGSDDERGGAKSPLPPPIKGFASPKLLVPCRSTRTGRSGAAGTRQATGVGRCTPSTALPSEVVSSGGNSRPRPGFYLCPSRNSCYRSVHFIPPRDSRLGFHVKYNSEWLYCASRCYSSKGDGSNASEGKHAAAKDAASFDKAKTRREKVRVDSRHCNEHALLGQKEQQEWLDSAKSSCDGKKRESPFLTKKERFRNEFIRRLIPWEKIAVSWDTFPYYLNEDTKNLLLECATSHLKRGKFASSYGSRLASSSGRILLQSSAGSELYRERLVRALARELQVPLLVLDSAALAPYDFGQEGASEDETDDENVESGEECAESEAEDENESNNEEELSSSNEANSDGSDDEDVDVQTSPEALRNIIPFSLEEFAQRVSGEDESTSTSTESDATTPPHELRGPLKKGDRVKYVGATVHLEVDNRPLSSGQRGEVYEVNGDQVAVILDSIDAKTKEAGKDEQISSGDARPSIYWINIQDIVRDQDTESEDWYIAVEAVHEILLSLQPVIVYFPDSSEWLSRAVPKSHRKEFISKLEEMFDQLPGPVLLICGQSKVEKGAPKEREKFRVVLPPLDRIGQLPFSLKRLTDGLKASKTSKTDDIYKVFTNIVYIHPPKDEELLRTFYKQLEEDRKIIISRNNLVELSKVLDEHELSCMELLNVKSDGVVLTKQ